MLRPTTYFSSFLLTLLVLSHCSTLPASLQEREEASSKRAKQDQTSPDKSSESGAQPYDVDAVSTRGVVQIAGQKVRYEATTGTLTQANDKGEDKAKMFFIAYRRIDSEQKVRPITFCFNGGPGSSSVWLHLGMLGPQRIRFPDDASLLQPPYASAENHLSLLDVTDLVFIDPVSTGYSRPSGDEDKSQFHGYSEDVASVAQFIHDWTSHYKRWTSPKFLLGESYGGIRAAGLADYLQSRYNFELNGIVVISGAINFQTLRFVEGNDLPYICFLPTYAATAWYHDALGDELQQRTVEDVVAEAEEFSLGLYAKVLLAGAAADPAEVDDVVTQMARLTGLSETYIRRSNLRISMSRFGKELLRDRDRTVGRFDSRYTGIDRDRASDGTEYDPSGSAIFGPFTAIMNQYLRGPLNYQQPRVYEILTGNVQPWNYDMFTGRYVDATESLRRAMTGNPYLKLYVACGYYDLATPHFAMEYTLNHLGLDDSLRDNISIGHYEGGHMMYIYEPALKQLRDELVKWYEEADGID